MLGPRFGPSSAGSDIGFANTTLIVFTTKHTSHHQVSVDANKWPDDTQHVTLKVFESRFAQWLKRWMFMLCWFCGRTPWTYLELPIILEIETGKSEHAIISSLLQRLPIFGALQIFRRWCNKHLLWMNLIVVHITNNRNLEITHEISCFTAPLGVFSSIVYSFWHASPDNVRWPSWLGVGLIRGCPGSSPDMGRHYLGWWFVKANAGRRVILDKWVIIPMVQTTTRIYNG